MPLFSGRLGNVSVGRISLDGQSRLVLLREVSRFPPDELLTAAMRSSHPAINRVLGIAEAAGEFYIVSEFFPGASTFELLGAASARDVALNPRVAARIARDALDASSTPPSRGWPGGSERGQIHLDTTWVTDSGRVRLTEVGLVAWLSDSADAVDARAMEGETEPNARAAAGLYFDLLGEQAPPVSASVLGSAGAAEVMRALEAAGLASDEHLAALLHVVCAAELIERRALDLTSSQTGSSGAEYERTTRYPYQDEVTRLQPLALPASERGRSARAAPLQQPALAALLPAFDTYAEPPVAREDLSEMTHVFRASAIPSARKQTAQTFWFTLGMPAPALIAASVLLALGLIVALARSVGFM